MTAGRLAGALAAWRAAPGGRSRAAVLAALPDSTVFLAVTPAPGAEGGTAMSVVSLRAPDGRRALLAFSNLAELSGWRSDVRPKAIGGGAACAGAVADGAAALLLDPAGAHFAVGPGELTELAGGRVPAVGVALSTHSGALCAPPGPVDPALLRALGAALAGEPVTAARVLAGPAGAVLGVVPARPLDAAALAALAGRVAARLGPELPRAGLDLALVAPGGPGHAVPIAR